MLTSSFCLVASVPSVDVKSLPPLQITDSVWAIFGAFASALVALATAILAYFTYRLAVDAVRAQSADYRASQQVKEALVQLAAVLLTVLRRCAVYIGTGREKKRLALSPAPPLSDELDLRTEFGRIAEFSFGAIGVGLTRWIGTLRPEIDAGQRPKGWRTFFMTLDETLHSTSASECARNIVAVLRLLATLSAADIRRISAAVGNLESLLGSLGQVLDSDIVIQSTTQTTPDRDDEYARTDAMFVFLKETCHVDDPNIDMFIASSTGDTALLERALNAGADPSLRSGEVLAKYADQLATFRSSGTAR